MKTSLITFILFSLAPLPALAQNAVVVKQKGNSNSATVIQNDDTANTDDCLETLAALNNKNVIVVKKPGAGDTLLTAGGRQYFTLSGVLNSKTKMEAVQKGLKNRLFVLLPDTQSALNYLKSTQTGKENKAVIQLSEADSIAVSQKGNNNTFRLNPCGVDKSRKQ